VYSNYHHHSKLHAGWCVEEEDAKENKNKSYSNLKENEIKM
jgi:hypothetical protein